MFACRRSRRQDVRHGDPLRQCRGFNAKGAPGALASPYAPRSAQPHHPLSVFVRSGETPERDGAVRRGGQQHLPGVSAPLPSGLRQVALPGGRKEEAGGTVELLMSQKCFNPKSFVFECLVTR